MEYITEIYNAIIGSTLYTIIAIAFLILIGYGIIKKLFKLVLIAAVCLLGYLGYIAITEGPEAALKESGDLKDDFLENLNDLNPFESSAIDTTGSKK